MSQNKLYKTKDGAVLGGVCAGFSEVYKMDVVLVRLLTIILGIFTGIPIILYIVMYLVMPDKKVIVEENKSEYKFEDDDYIY